jgi:1-acyl-sn-glycerol-3-phosphate acyltransferase
MATTEAERLHGAELGWFSTFLYRWFHWFTKALVGVYFRAWVINPENLPDEGAVIISPVHRSNLDVPLLGITCKRRARYFAKDSLFRTRIGRWIVITLGGFPVKRDATDRAALQAAQAVLERGEVLAMFPEGERKEGTEVHELLRGVAYVAGKAQAPILPVGIGGSQRGMPKGVYFPRPRKITYIYGELIQPPVLSGKRLPKAEINRVTEELHAAIQALFDEAQAAVGADHDRPVLASE